MTECPSCALDIPEDADVCPYCGYDLPQPDRGNQAAAILFALLLILPLLWWVWRLF
jgi:predicted nucleic acid-binding Zn ribbon protein